MKTYIDTAYRNEQKNILRYISERIKYCKDVIRPIPKESTDYTEIISNWRSKIIALEDLYSWVVKFDKP